VQSIIAFSQASRTVLAPKQLVRLVVRVLLPAVQPPGTEGHHITGSDDKGENAWRHTYTLHTPSRCVQRKFMIKPNDKQPSEIRVPVSGIHNDSARLSCSSLPIGK